MSPPAGRSRPFARHTLATMALLAMAALFALSHVLAPRHPGWAWPLAFSEAALIGGLADWFAVTALFRRPLGLPIPHTAIIPANKARIAGAMAEFLRVHFLTPQVVARRLGAMRIAARVGGWLADPHSHADARLRRGLAVLAADLVNALDGERQLGRRVKRGLARRLDRLDLAPLLGALLRRALAEGRQGPLIEAVLRQAGLLIEANEPLLRGIIAARAHVILRWTGLDATLTHGILDGLYRLLAECIVDPNHPLRREIEAGLARLAEDLSHDATMNAQVARAKRAVLTSPAFAAWLDARWEEARAWLLSLVDAEHDAIHSAEAPATGTLAMLGAMLRDDPRLRGLGDRMLRRAIVGLAQTHGAAIVSLVSETVKRWDGPTIAARIEGTVWRDLQFIRLNGTLVGGLIGVVLHALTLVIG